MAEKETPNTTPTTGHDDMPDFERSLAELEALVERMERGEQHLEDALRDFERGIQLTRSCQLALTKAEQKVEILLENREDADAVPFHPIGE